MAEVREIATNVLEEKHVASYGELLDLMADADLADAAGELRARAERHGLAQYDIGDGRIVERMDQRERQRPSADRTGALERPVPVVADAAVEHAAIGRPACDDLLDRAEESLTGCRWPRTARTVASPCDPKACSTQV